MAGEDHVRISNGYGKMIHAFCTNCGTGIYQYPDGATFRAVFPTTFQIHDASNEKSCMLPEEYLPKAHVNYENRLTDWFDELPKYKTNRAGIRVTNNGEPIQE